MTNDNIKRQAEVMTEEQMLCLVQIAWNSGTKGIGPIREIVTKLYRDRAKLTRRVEELEGALQTFAYSGTIPIHLRDEARAALGLPPTFQTPSEALAARGTAAGEKKN